MHKLNSKKNCLYIELPEQSNLNHLQNEYIGESIKKVTILLEYILIRTILYHMGLYTWFHIHDLSCLIHFYDTKRHPTDDHLKIVPFIQYRLSNSTVVLFK